MNKTNSTYLSLYKEYETLIRATGKEPKEYEDNLPEHIANKLRLCRQIRNFLVHDADEAFLTAGQGQISFMERVIKELKNGKETLKKHAKSPTAGICSPKDKIIVAIEKMTKLKTDKIIIYDDKSGKYTLLSIYNAISTYFNSKNATISDAKTTKGSLYFDTADREYDKVKNMAKNNDIDVIVVTKNGESNESPAGVIYVSP